MLYLQNSDSFITIDSVTSLHPIYRFCVVYMPTVDCIHDPPPLLFDKWNTAAVATARSPVTISPCRYRWPRWLSVEQA